MREATHSRYLSAVEIVVAILLLAYPTLMLTVKGGMNGVFLLMLLLAITVWLVRPKGMNAVAWRQEWTIYTAAMFAMTAAIFISQSHHQNFAAHPHDAASRYWLVIPVFLLLQRLRPKVFTVLQFAFPVAALAGFFMAKDMGGRSGVVTLDLIHSGDFELILGMLSLLSIDWFGQDKLPIRILKILGFMAGLLASFASGTRGGWLAIPVFIAIFFYFRTDKVSRRVFWSSLVTTMLGLMLVFLSSSTFHQRVNEFVNDVSIFGQGKRDTSTGIRWQLYKASIDVFIQNPVFGVGPEGFASEMKPMMEAGKITSEAAELGRGEVHNDILSKSAGMGVFGLIAILAIYFVPLGLFWNAAKAESHQVKRAGILGITFVSGFFVFGLTVEFLNLTMATAFYSFTVAVLLAACFNTYYSVHSSVSQQGQ